MGTGVRCLLVRYGLSIVRVVGSREVTSRFAEKGAQAAFWLHASSTILKRHAEERAPETGATCFLPAEREKFLLPLARAVALASGVVPSARLHGEKGR